MSSPPWVWFGFVFAIAFLSAEFADLILDFDKQSLGHRYPIQPGEAVGKHFIPFYNLYWLFVWPSTLSSHLNQAGRVNMLPGGLIGFVLLVSLLLRYVDGAIGLALTFAVGLYISAKLRKHMKLVKGIAPELLPPPPDPGMFRTDPAPTESAAGEVATSPKIRLS